MTSTPPDTYDAAVENTERRRGFMVANRDDTLQRLNDLIQSTADAAARGALSDVDLAQRNADQARLNASIDTLNASIANVEGTLSSLRQARIRALLDEQDAHREAIEQHQHAIAEESRTIDALQADIEALRLIAPAAS